MNKKIDEKHHIEVHIDAGSVYPRMYIVKTSNGVPIPDDEPTILFRGRDRLALKMLHFYRELCVADGCTDYQLATLDKMIGKFEAFALTSPTMKQPGCTHGK